MKKTFINIAIGILLVGIMVVGTVLFPRKLKSDPSNPEISSAATVLEVISDKIEETADDFAKCASASNTSGAEVSATAIPGGFTKEDASEYLWLNALSSRIVFAVDYLANNATT